LAKTTRPQTYAIILAGGAGTRLWPLARASRPKPFLPLVQGQSLFRLTYERIAPLTGLRHVVVVAAAEHRSWVRRQAHEVAADRLLLEERGRNTAAAVAAAALWVRARSPNGIMIVLPSDHFITPVAVFRAAMRRAVRAADGGGGLVTIGVPARHPDTGFGYIRPTKRLVAPGIHRVSLFAEKPGAARARAMVRSGRYLWNSGIFVWKAEAILDELGRHAPEVLEPLASWARHRRAGPWRIPARILRRVPSLPIDKAVLEKSTRTLVQRATFRWSDLGNWDALGDILPRDRRGNGGIGRVVAFGSSGCLGVSEGGLTVFVGVSDLAAVRSGDVLLVCHRRSAQQVREIAQRFRAGRSTAV